VSKIINILASVLTLLIIASWYFFNISLYYLFPILISYIAVVTFGTLNISFNYFFHSYCNSNTSKKEIALTFDDGPHPDITPKLISLLNSYNIPATFFCTGKNALANSHIVESIHKNNHIIGNHSYGHSGLFDLFTSTRMHKEIVDTNEIIEKVTGRSPLFFRPPYGITNPLLRKALKKTKMVSIGWSLRPFDTVINPQKVISSLKANTKPGDIVLFHDTNPNIIAIIEDYLIWLQKNDFKIVSLTFLLNIPAYEN
jgi:peptidoglycan/xylan/chitin deacetylase (PgdA/CDA1 family)